MVTKLNNQNVRVINKISEVGGNNDSLVLFFLFFSQQRQQHGGRVRAFI